MGKNKLRKFAEMDQLSCVYQYPFAVIRQQKCPLRGQWGAEVFDNNNPIVLELGCGKGEYTVGLARDAADKNFIGIDIKGARMYTGAKIVENEHLANAAFLRTSIELLPEFFAPGEVSEIWITFPDPQMKKANKRLTGTHFLDLYQQSLASGGLVRLKTDSPFLYAYTSAMLQASGITPVAITDDLYQQGTSTDDNKHLVLPSGHQVPNIRTHYEAQWLQRGFKIKYIAFQLSSQDKLVEPDIEIEPDNYRSYHRDSVPTSID